MIFVEIKNWKVLVNQFGLTNTKDTRSAKQISQQLKAIAAAKSYPEYISIPYQLEANGEPYFDSGEATFKQASFVNHICTYEYTGTIK